MLICPTKATALYDPGALETVEVVVLITKELYIDLFKLSFRQTNFETQFCTLDSVPGLIGLYCLVAFAELRFLRMSETKSFV